MHGSVLVYVGIFDAQSFHIEFIWVALRERSEFIVSIKHWSVIRNYRPNIRFSMSVLFDGMKDDSLMFKIVIHGTFSFQTKEKFCFFFLQIVVPSGLSCAICHVHRKQNITLERRNVSTTFIN
jgi:hypothetical protein